MSQEAFNFKSAKLSIVVPVFNEVQQITRNLDLLLGEVDDHFEDFEVIVVSDGSTDGTNAKLLSLKHPRIRPIIVEKNTGKGNAVRVGFQAAAGDYVLFIDGGMEIHPKEIRIFMGLMSLYQCDVVVGSKRHPQARVQYPWYRKFLSWCFQQIVRVLFKIDVTDTQVGIKLFRREVVEAVLPHMEINRYGFDLEMLSLAKHLGYDRILEAPIQLDYSDSSRRFIFTDLYHVFKISYSLFKDTFHLYMRLPKIKAGVHPALDKAEKRAG